MVTKSSNDNPADADSAEFDALVVRSGLTLTEAQCAELRVGYGYVKAMAARVRGHGKRPREAEPATIFRADR